eukprot:m.289281 g.289281  ORF g.289281 m.289281 type:complete len:140 (+) comp40714_c0_seq11:146-565(+)
MKADFNEDVADNGLLPFRMSCKIFCSHRHAIVPTSSLKLAKNQPKIAPSQLCTSTASLTLSTSFLNGSEFWFVGEYTVYDGSGLVFETLTLYHQLPPSDDVGRIGVQFIYLFGEGETTVSLPMEHTLEREVFGRNHLRY